MPLVRYLVPTAPNIYLIRKTLSEIAVNHAAFDMVTKYEKSMVKLSLLSEDLDALHRDIRTKLSGGLVFGFTGGGPDALPAAPLAAAGGHGSPIHNLKKEMNINPHRFSRRPGVTVKTKITDIDEADRICEEVANFDLKTLGNMRAVGVRLFLQKNTSQGNPDSEHIMGPVLLFKGKS